MFISVNEIKMCLIKSIQSVKIINPIQFHFNSLTFECAT